MVTLIEVELPLEVIDALAQHLELLQFITDNLNLRSHLHRLLTGQAIFRLPIKRFKVRQRSFIVFLADMD